jgi:hypothetical protein
MWKRNGMKIAKQLESKIHIHISLFLIKLFVSVRLFADFTENIVNYGP